MKKYDIGTSAGNSLLIEESNNGNWVKARDVEKLENLNKELTRTLQLFVDCEQFELTSTDRTLVQTKLMRITNQAKELIEKSKRTSAN